MATTTNYSWETPDDTDLVKDGAAAIRTLGSSIDTTTKALNPSTTLGDIEYRSSTANTNTRLGIGSTGQVLTVSGGIPSWATPTSATPTFVGVKLNAVLKQSVTNNTDTAMIFDVEDFDTDGFHSNVTNNTRITIPAGKAGYYQIGGLIDFDNGAGGARTLRIKKNGTTEKQIITTPNTVYPGATLETILYLAVGDYVQLFATQTSGTTQDLYVDGSNGQLYAYFIGA